jgi:four helix bundle protein
VWQKARSLARRTYQFTGGLPPSEKRGLIDQMRRSAVSVASNIAEGAAMDTDAQFSRFLGYALASASELHSQLDVCSEVGLGDRAEHASLDRDIDEVKRMLTGLRKRLR